MKKNLVYAVAMAGLGTRFTRAGYVLPKYMLRAAGATSFLTCESWCRVAGGSGQRHVVSAAGSTLVDEGFV